MLNEFDVIVKNLSKSFPVPRKDKSLFNFWQPSNESIHALKEISFKVRKGEILGYIGPNGSGKSTTIKILTGILHPSSGEANVLGFVPWKQRYEYSFNTGVVFGQKSLLWWDIAPWESFKLYKEVYELDNGRFQERLQHLVKLFDIEPFMFTPTRKLSLGERMRCELVASLINEPKILFLDEPTIGLDAIAKNRMREAIRSINEKENTTVMLTTHDMSDIEELATKILILDQGTIIYKGTIDDLKKNFVKQIALEFELEKALNRHRFDSFLKKAKTVEREQNHYYAIFSLDDFSAPEAASALLNSAKVSHFELKTPSLEEVIRDVYNQQKNR